MKVYKISTLCKGCCSERVATHPDRHPGGHPGYDGSVQGANTSERPSGCHLVS